MDGTEKVILKEFNAEKIAPNFLNFLKQFGEVTVGKADDISLGVNEQALPASLRHQGVQKEILLDGVRVGVLRVFSGPFSKKMNFLGEIPNVPKRKRERVERIERVDSDKVVWTSVSVGYQFDRPSRVQIEGKHPNRDDGWWDVIPFP